MRSLNVNLKPRNEIYELIGKGVNSYTAVEKEQLLCYTRTVSSDIINNKNNAILDRLQFGEKLDFINQQETINKYLSEVPQNELFLARIRINPILSDKYSIDITHPKLLSKHFLACKVKNNSIYYHFFTSNPRPNTLYNVFSVVDLVNRNNTQSISKYQGVLESIYISEIEVLSKKNAYGINVDLIFNTLIKDSYFSDDIHYNNKYYSLLADDVRLSKVKKNINIIYPFDE